MTMVYMIDRGDDASEKLHSWLRSERGVLNRDIIHIKGESDLALSLKFVLFDDKTVDLYVPTLYTGMGDGSPFAKTDVELLKNVFLSQGIDVRFYFPFQSLQLLDIIKAKETDALCNGDCPHREVEEEQCGICLDCIEKALCYKLCERPIDEIFMEDPLEGYGSHKRMMEVLARLTQNQFGFAKAPSRSDVAIGSLLISCFFEGHLPKALSADIETHHQILLTEG